MTNSPSSLRSTQPAGLHILIDMWGARFLSDQAHLERAVIEAVVASKATLLNLFLHAFGETGGITGVAILAESHISLHTWPEHGYAAFDIFMCGNCDPHAAVSILRHHLQPTKVSIHEVPRGIT